MGGFVRPPAFPFLPIAMVKFRLLLLAIIQLSCISSFSGNIPKIHKKYKTHLTAEGMVYFIMPQKMAKTSDSKALKNLVFDLSCLVTTDTVSLTATIHSTTPITDSLVTVIPAEGVAISSQGEFLFRELGKKGYVNRIRFKLTRSQLRQLFSAEKPFLLEYGNNHRFAFRNKEWSNKRQLFISILDLMDLNQ